MFYLYCTHNNGISMCIFWEYVYYTSRSVADMPFVLDVYNTCGTAHVYKSCADAIAISEALECNASPMSICSAMPQTSACAPAAPLTRRIK